MEKRIERRKKKGQAEGKKDVRNDRMDKRRKEAFR